MIATLPAGMNSVAFNALLEKLAKRPLTTSLGQPDITQEHIPITQEQPYNEHIPIMQQPDYQEHIPTIPQGPQTEHIPVSQERPFNEYIPIIQKELQPYLSESPKEGGRVTPEELAELKDEFKQSTKVATDSSRSYGVQSKEHGKMDAFDQRKFEKWVNSPDATEGYDKNFTNIVEKYRSSKLSTPKEGGGIPLRPQSIEKTSASPLRPTKGWETDMGSMPGEPSLIHKNGVIIERADEQGNVLYEAMNNKGQSLGIFPELDNARKVVELSTPKGEDIQNKLSNRKIE
jgi:hypothetical protein